MAEIVNDWPPNIAAIRAVLPVSRRNIFAYGGKIYSPGSKTLDPWLIAHERVHFRQQAAHEGGVDGWWDQFLRSPTFRLEQELEAHREEYRVRLGAESNRAGRRRALAEIAARLAKPMYGGLISRKEAMRRIA